MIDPIKYINETTNIAFEHQNALGFALPPITFFKDTVTVKEGKSVEGNSELQNRLKSGLVENTNWIIPLTFKASGLFDFKFPLDPIISIASKNIITRRYVSKSINRGSIKEHWSQDDWEISITGVIIDENEVTRNDKIRNLRWFLDYEKSIDVVCPLFNDMSIMRISIETYDFPFTKGVENQAFVIKAYSDGDYDLLIKN